MNKIIYPLLISIVFFSCGDSEENFDTNIVINLQHLCDNELLSNNSLSHVSEAGENYNVQTLKYIITDLQLIAIGGDAVFASGDERENILLKDFHYVDINDPSTLFIDKEITGNGAYALSFTFGIDSINNISNSLVNESFHPTMAWPDMMGGGYHYMKLEGAYMNDSTFYNTHTGPTMGMDFSFTKTFDMLINLDNNSILEYAIQMNVNNWYHNPHTINLAPAIMMDMPKQMQLMSNGMTDVFTIQGLLD